MSNKIFKTNGYTLVEILVSMSIFSIIVVLGGNYIVTSFKATAFQEEQSQAIVNARNIISDLKVEIRGAINSEQGAYPISLIDSDEIIFFSDIDEDGDSERIRYYINEQLMIKEVTEPGALNDYGDPPSSKAVSESLNNQEEAVFAYYDSDYITTGTINEVRLIKIVLKINVTPEVAPNDFYVETDVTLRNLKSNL